MIKNLSNYRNKKLILNLATILIGITILSLTLGSSLLNESKPNIVSFIGLHFAGYLFFLLMPVETIFLYYLSVEHNPLTLFIFAILTAILAQLIDYLIGLIFARKLIEDYLNVQKYTRLKKSITKHSRIIIFLFNLSILSSPIIVLIAGMMKIRIRDVLIYSFLGLVIKYLVLIGIYYIFGNIF